MNQGSSNRSKYDVCSYEKDLYESTSPLAYQLYFGKHENCSRCISDRLWTRYQVVDIESELRNQTRPLSNCDQFKYSPSCKRSGLCISTFDKSVPIVPGVSTCPIIYNNIPRQTHPGYTLPESNPCNYRM